MESGFRLRKENQVLRHALFLQDPLDHLAIAAAALQTMLKRAPPSRGKIINVARHLVGHHQREVGMGGLNLCRGLRFQIGIDRIVRHFVGFVDRSRL